MTTLSTEVHDALLLTLMQRARFVSLHTSATDDGSNELGGRFYQRREVNWNNGVNADEIRFTLPDCTVAYIGYWDAAYGGTFQCGAPTTPKHADEGDQYLIPRGNLRLSVQV